MNAENRSNVVVILFLMVIFYLLFYLIFYTYSINSISIVICSLIVFHNASLWCFLMTPLPSLKCKFFSSSCFRLNKVNGKTTQCRCFRCGYKNKNFYRSLPTKKKNIISEINYEKKSMDQKSLIKPLVGLSVRVKAWRLNITPESEKGSLKLLSDRNSNTSLSSRNV